MNPPLKNRFYSSWIVKFFIFFLFLTIGSSLFGSKPGGLFNVGNEEKIDTNKSQNAEKRNTSVTDTTERNRHSLDPVESTDNNRFLIEPTAGDAKQGFGDPQQPSVENTLAASTDATQLGTSAVGLSKNSHEEIALSTTPRKPSRLSVDGLERRFKKTVKSIIAMNRVTKCFTPTKTQNEKEFEQSELSILQNRENATQAERTQIARQSALIKQQFKQQQASLQQKFLQTKQEAIERSTISALSRNLASDCFYPEIAIAALKKEYISQESIVQLAERIALYPIENRFLFSYLSKRKALLENETAKNTSNEELNEKAVNALKLVQDQGTALINLMIPSVTTEHNNELTKLTSEQIDYLNNLLDLLRTTQLFILGCHTAPYMTASKDKLDEIENLLTEIPKTQNFPINSDEVTSAYNQSLSLCSSSKATFSLMETFSAKASFLAGEQNATTIQKQLEETKNLENAFREEENEAKPARKQMLQGEAAAMEQLHACLQNAMLAYSEIKDEAWIEQESGHLHDLKERIETQKKILQSQAAALKISTKNQELFDSINALLEEPSFKLDAAETLPQHPSLFLAKLASLDKSLSEQRIIGTHGKIALDDLPEKIDDDYAEEVRRDWRAGINLIRLALCRDFGFHIMQEFDEQSRIIQRENNSLSVLRLKKFLFDEHDRPKYFRGFFIVSEMEHEHFLKYLTELSTRGETEDAITPHKIIKIDDITLAFNPFVSKNQSEPPTIHQETTAATELRQRQAGFEYTREALKMAFPEAFLSTEQLEQILERFDDQFKITTFADEKAPLTLQAAADFINTQKEMLSKRGCWERYVTRYWDQDSIQHFRHGFFFNMGTYILPVLIGLLSYLYYHSLIHTIP